MSHVATIKVKIRDLEALAKAAQECGLLFVEGQTSYRWYGQWVNDYHGNDAAYKNGVKPEDYGKCQHALTNPDSPHGYEIGVIESPDGDGYTLIWDFYGQKYGGGLMPKIGRNGELLSTEYKVQATASQLRKRGFNFSIERDKQKGARIVAEAR